MTENRRTTHFNAQNLLGRCDRAVAVKLTGGSHERTAVNLSTDTESWADGRPLLLEQLLAAKDRINREVDARRRTGEISPSF